MIGVVNVIASLAVLVMIAYTFRIQRANYRELDRRQEFTELRLLAIETALREHGIVVQDTPED